MTDKEKIREVIEKRYEYWKEKEFNSHSIESEIRMSECQHLLLRIDSLPEEPASEDLEEELDRRFGKTNNYSISDFAKLYSRKDFKNGAEWQKQKDKQLVGATQKISHQHGYDEGRFDMKEEMMKDAMEGEIGDIMPLIEVGEMNNYLNYVKAHGLKIGDKVKIVVLKTE